jgi:hypothetical protein
MGVPMEHPSLYLKVLVLETPIFGKKCILPKQKIKSQTCYTCCAGKILTKTNHFLFHLSKQNFVFVFFEKFVKKFLSLRHVTPAVYFYIFASFCPKNTGIRGERKFFRG